MSVELQDANTVAVHMFPTFLCLNVRNALHSEVDVKYSGVLRAFCCGGCIPGRIEKALFLIQLMLCYTGEGC